MNKFCPNFSIPAIKARFNELGPQAFYEEYISNNYQVPDVFNNLDESSSVEEMLFVNKELFDAHQQNSIKNSIIYQIRKYIQTNDPDYILTSKDIRDTILADFENSRDFFKDSEDPDEVEITRNLSNVIDNFDKFWEIANRDLKKLGISQKPITGIQEDNNTPTEEAAYDSEEAVYQKLNYSDGAAFEQSSKDTASAHMKLVLSMVPKYEYEDGKVVTEIDEDGNEYPVADRNLIGMMEFEPLDVIWNDMLYTMSDMPMGTKVDYLKNSSNPRHRAIYDLLRGYDSETGHFIQGWNSEQYINEFEVTFSKQQAKFITAVARRPTPLYVYDPLTKTRQVSRDSSGAIQYANRSISIIDTNRSNPENTLFTDWYNNFLNTSLVTSDVNGNLYVDTYKGKKLKEFFEEAVNKWDIPLLIKVFKTMGITISEEALKSEGIYINKELTSTKDIVKFEAKYIFDRLAGEVDSKRGDTEDTSTSDNSLEANNPFLMEDRPLSLLAKLENKVNPGVFESSFISGDNKSKYSFVNNTYATWQYNKIINSPEYLNKLKTTAYASESYWLNQLLNNPDFVKHFEFKYVDTLGNDANNQTNKTFNQMSDREREYYRLSVFQNNGQTVSADRNSNHVGYFIGLTPSDKTTLPMFKTVLVKVSSNENFKINSAAKEVIRDQFISEYKRVKQTLDQNEDSSIIPIKNYHGKNGMGSKFIIFPMMNNLLFEDGKLITLDDTRFDEIVDPALDSFIEDIIKDQISYWTELGIYHEGIFDKTYASKIGLNNKNIDIKLRDFAANYAVNNFIALMNQTQLFSGDVALFGKTIWEDIDKRTNINITSSINQTWTNFFKRMAKDIAPGLDPNFDNSTLEIDKGIPENDTSKFFNTIFLKDLEYSSEHLSEYRKIIGSKVDQNGSYGKINPADAQEYTTLREHLVVMKALGRLSPEQEEAGERLLKGGSLESDIKLILQPMKPVYVEGSIEDGINKIYYIKTSSFPLIPALTRGLEIDKLRQAMEDNNIQRAVYESGVKVGLQGDLNVVSNDGGSTFNTLKIDPKQIINLPRTGFRIQQEIPTSNESMINQGSQGRKLILSNINDSDKVIYNNHEISGKVAKNIFENLHMEKINRAFDEFKNEIGVDPITGRINNIERLVEILREEAEDRDYPLNDIYALNIIEEDGVKKFKVPFAFVQSAQRFESVLNSIVTNRALKSKLPGFSLVQGASSGFRKVQSDENLSEYKSDIIWVNPNDTKLNYIREENGKLISADILVPNYLRDNDGELININEYIVGGYLATDSLPEELLTIIGIRIPTQGLNSMMKFRVKGFLPNYMGDLAIVPAEITSQMGSDFDVDKLFFFNYHSYQDNEGNLKKITKDFELYEEYRKITVDLFDEIFENSFDTSRLPDNFKIFEDRDIPSHTIIQQLQSIANGTMDIGISKNSENGKLLDDVRKVVKDIVTRLTNGTMNLGKEEVVSLDYSKLSNKEIDNLIIQMYEDRLSDPNVFADILEPNGFGKLPEVSDTVSNIIDEVKSKHTFTSREQNNVYGTNSAGKIGTALFSLSSTFFKASQDAKLSLIKGAAFKFLDSKGELVELNNLYEVNNIEGEKRSNVIMYLQSAAVDNANEQILGNLNINEHTMNVASTMAMLGLPEDFIGYFMSQPVIREFASIMANKSDIIEGGEKSFNTDFQILADLIDSKLGNVNIDDLMPVLNKINYGSKHLKDLLEDSDSSKNTNYLLDEVNIEVTDLQNQVPNLLELKILIDFSNLLDLSNDIRSLQSVINVDTKGIGTSFASTEAKFTQYLNINKRLLRKEFGILNAESVQNLLQGETTIASSLGVLLETRGLFGNINLYTGAVYENIFSFILSGVGLAPTENNLKDLYSNFRSYLLSSKDLINTEDVNALRDELLLDPENNIAIRWDRYSKSEKGSRNILTKRIRPKFQESKTVKKGGKTETVFKPNSYNGLTALNTPASSNAQDINNATMYFYDMINSDDVVERELAEDLVRYFIITGANFGPNSIGKYINYDILEKYNFSKKTRDIYNSIMNREMEHFSPFIDQYFQNNPFKAKSIKLNEFKDSFEISMNAPEILNKNGNPSPYLVAYDTAENRPVLYTLVTLTTGDLILYQQLPILGNKTLKNYNFGVESVNKDTGNLENREDVGISYTATELTPEIEDSTSTSEIISNNYDLSSNDVESILNRIVQISQVPEFKQLAQTLLKNIPAGFNINIIDQLIPGNGSYDNRDKTIRINTNAIAQFDNYNDKFEQVFLEELLHALTVNNLNNTENLTPKQVTARNKIIRLYREYLNNHVDKDKLNKFNTILDKKPELRTSEEITFLRDNMNTLYPLSSVAEFIGQGLTKPEFREILKSNNFWTRLVDLIKNLLGIDTQTDLDFLFSSTLELINTTENQSNIINNENLPTSSETININTEANENADLSNFAIRPFVVGTGKFQSVEQYFQYQKWHYLREDISEEDFQKNVEILDSIMNTTDGETLKRLGEQFTNLNSNDWNSNASVEMLTALRESFIQNPDALQRLLSTGDAILTYNKGKSKWDKEFPKLLMEIREELRRDHNFNIDEPNRYDIDEYNRRQFIIQRDNFFKNWRVKDYWNNQHKKYTAEAQRKFLTANGRPGYDRLKIEFWNNELRVRREDPIILTRDVNFNVDDNNTVSSKSRQEIFIDRMISRFENTIKRLRSRLKTATSEAELKRIELQLEKSSEKLEELKLDKNIISIVDAIAKRIKRIENIIESDNVDYSELSESFDYLKEIITLNQEVEFDSETELGKRYTDRADRLSGKASGLLNKLKDKAAKLVQEWATSEIDWAVAPDITSILSKGIKDVGQLESGNLDATQSSSEHIQALQYLIDYAQLKADKEHDEFMSELSQIEQDYNKKYGKDYSQLYQLDENGKPTKFLLNKYKDEYYKTTAGNFKSWFENSDIVITEENKKAFEEAKNSIRDIVGDQDYLNWLRDNDPELYIKDFKTGKKFNSFRPASRYVTIRPKDKWIDPRYEELKSRDDNDPAKRMYLLLEPKFRKLNSKYGSSQINYVPEVQQDTIQYFMKGNLKGGISKMWEDFSKDIRSDVYISQTSPDLDPLTNEPRMRIPIRFFGDNVKTEDRSTDLPRIAELVMYQEVSNKVKHEIEPLLNIYYILLRDAKQNKGVDEETGEIILIDKPASRITEQAEFIINGWLYGLYRSTEEGEQKYGKATDAVINYVRLKGMAYNPFSAIGNIMQGIMSNYTFAGGGQFFGQKDFLKSTYNMLFSLAGNTEKSKKISNAFIYFDSFVRHNEMNHGASRELSRARGSYSRWYEPMGLQQSGEYFVQGQTMLGVLHKEKVKNKNGEMVPVWEAFDNDFNWKTEEFGPNPYDDPKNLFKIRSRIRKAIDDVHGNYARPIMNKKHFYWRLVYTFRTWLPQAINNRFGGERQDILLGDVTKGRYRSVPALWKDADGKFDFDILRQNIASLIKLGGKSTLSPLDLQNMQKNVSELILLATITAAIMLLRAGMDDWDEDTKELWTYAYNNLMRARGDVLFFIDPKSAQTILRDPVAAMGALNDFIDIVEASLDTVYGDGIYQSGINKGKLKIVKETIDNIPFINQIPKNLQYADKVFTN